MSAYVHANFMFLFGLSLSLIYYLELFIFRQTFCSVWAAMQIINDFIDKEPQL